MTDDRLDLNDLRRAHAREKLRVQRQRERDRRAREQREHRNRKQYNRFLRQHGEA